MISPAKKLELVRKFDRNPSAAFIEALEILGKEYEAKMLIHLEQATGKAKAELVELVDTKIGKIKMPDMDILLQNLSGNDGEDAEAAEVAEMLLAMPEFVKLVKGDEGHTPSEEELLALIMPRIPQVKDGYTPMKGVDFNDGAPGPKPTDEELLSLMKPLLERELPTTEELTNLITLLMPPREARETGEEIVAKINALPILPEMQIDASHIKNLPRPKQPKNKKGGGAHGGGDSVFYYDLSDQTDGVKRSFAIPANSKLIWVGGTDSPGGQYRIGSDVTGSGTSTLTISSSMAAPTQGATLHIQYVV